MIYPNQIRRLAGPELTMISGFNAGIFKKLHFGKAKEEVLPPQFYPVDSRKKVGKECLALHRKQLNPICKFIYE